MDETPITPRSPSRGLLLGIALLLLGAALMIGGYLYDPYDRFSELDRLSEQGECLNRSITRGGGGLDCVPQPLAVYSPARAGNRQMIFMGGGALLLLGGIFAAAGTVAARHS